MRHVLLVILLLGAGCLEASPEAAEPSLTMTASSPPGVSCDAAGFALEDTDATIVTSRGEIDIVLYGAQSPISVCNFLQYVEDGFYEGTIWHRICAHVIQAGGYDPYTMQQKPTRGPIQNEATTSQLRNYQGTLGMAREDDPDSATSHFFINNRDNLYLDYDGDYAPGYAVFGNVTGGWDVVEDIMATQTVPDPPDSGCAGIPLPTEQTTITDVRVG